MDGEVDGEVDGDVDGAVDGAGDGDANDPPRGAPGPSRPRRRIESVKPAGRADDLTRAVPRVEPPRRGSPASTGSQAGTGSRAGTATEVWPTVTQPTQRLDAAVEPRYVPAARSRPPAWKIALLLLAAIAAIGAAIVVGTRSVRPQQDGTGGVATATPNAKHPPQKDVALDGCTLDASGVAATGTVHNPTDDPADYVIEVHLVDQSGTVITTGRSNTTGVDPGTTTTWSATLPPTPSDAPSATCKIVQVDRYRA